LGAESIDEIASLERDEALVAASSAMIYAILCVSVFPPFSLSCPLIEQPSLSFSFALMATIESERLLIARDFAGALDAATRHVESPALGLFATRERALAVAVQALHELGRGEQAFELVLSTVAGPGGGGGSDAKRYALVAELNLGLLKLLFRLRTHLDGKTLHAQKILAPYIAGLCRRRSDPFQRWSRSDVHDEVDVETVELFILDCVLSLEVRFFVQRRQGAHTTEAVCHRGVVGCTRVLRSSTFR